MIKTYDKIEEKELYKKAKIYLYSYQNLIRECKFLAKQISEREALIQGSNGSLIKIPDSGSQGTRSALIAGLVDLQETKYRKLLEMELAGLEILSKIDRLDDKNLVHYLKLHFIYGLNYLQISNEVHYSIRQTKNFMIRSINYFSNVHQIYLYKQ